MTGWVSVVAPLFLAFDDRLRVVVDASAFFGTNASRHGRLVVGVLHPTRLRLRAARADIESFLVQHPDDARVELAAACWLVTATN